MFWILLIISFFWPPCWFAFGAYCLYLIFKSIIRHMGMRAHVNNLHLMRTIREMVEEGIDTETLQGISMPSLETFAEIYGKQTAIHSQSRIITCLLVINAETYFVALQHNGADMVQISIMTSDEYKQKLKQKIMRDE